MNNNNQEATVPVSRESPQAIGTLFIGHLVFYSSSEDGPPLLSFGNDWDEALLTKKEALEAFRGRLSDEWLCDIAEKFASTGAAMLHFHVVKARAGRPRSRLTTVILAVQRRLTSRSPVAAYGGRMRLVGGRLGVDLTDLNFTAGLRSP